jgi:hypothetical protein
MDLCSDCAGPPPFFLVIKVQFALKSESFGDYDASAFHVRVSSRDRARSLVLISALPLARLLSLHSRDMSPLRARRGTQLSTMAQKS